MELPNGSSVTGPPLSARQGAGVLLTRRGVISGILGTGVALGLISPNLTEAAAAAEFGQTADPNLVALLPSTIAKRGTITVAVALGSPPNDFRNEEGRITGWEPDILRAVAGSLGLQLHLRPTTFDALIPGLQSRRFDAAVGNIGLTEAREKVVDMVGTLTGNELFAARADSDLKVKSLDDICGHTVAVTRGSREYEFALAQQRRCESLGKPPIDILTFNSAASAADALMSKRADLFWAGSTAIGYFVRQSRERAKLVGSYTDKSYLGIALPKNSPLVPALQAAIQHLIEDGTYRKIVKKWGLESGAITKVPVNPKGAPT